MAEKFKVSKNKILILVVGVMEISMLRSFFLLTYDEAPNEWE